MRRFSLFRTGPNFCLGKNSLARPNPAVATPRREAGNFGSGERTAGVTILTLLTFLIILTVSSPVFAQEATPTSATRRRDDRIEQRVGERQDKIQDRKAEIQAKRTEKQQQIVTRMKEKLSAVIDRLNNVAARLHDHVAKIRSRAAELKTNRGANIAAVESALSEAEKHIGLAETEIANIKSKLSELDATDTPKDVAQTFRTGVQSVHSHFKDVRTNLVTALKALRDIAKESRPTRPAEE